MIRHLNLVSPASCSLHLYFNPSYSIFQVRAAIKVKASVIICFTSSGRAARYLIILLSIECARSSENDTLHHPKQPVWLVSLLLYVSIFNLLLMFAFKCRLIAKYRPTMPVLSVVIPRLKTNQLKWSFSGAFEVLPVAVLLMGCVVNFDFIYSFVT